MTIDTILVNRLDKEIAWTLGEEDNYDILKQQHNPYIISLSPPTVLVADSDNYLAIEYRLENDTWNATLSYGVGLNWPRNADRLPNGNTLITVTKSEKVIEVTPDGAVVWKASTPKYPYDAERLPLPDGSTGPTMAELRETNRIELREGVGLIGTLSTRYQTYYDLSQGVLPLWITQEDFLLLHFSAYFFLTFISYELVELLRARNVPPIDIVRLGIATIVFVVVSVSAIPISSRTGIFAVVALFTILYIESILTESVGDEICRWINGFTAFSGLRLIQLGRITIGGLFALAIIGYLLTSFRLRRVAIHGPSYLQITPSRRPRVGDHCVNSKLGAIVNSNRFRGGAKARFDLTLISE